MSEITKEQVEHVANLARLHLSEEEKQTLATDMASILDFAQKLSALDEALDNLDLDEANDEYAVKNVCREDKVKQSLAIEQVLYNTADHEDDQVKVPSVLEG